MVKKIPFNKFQANYFNVIKWSNSKHKVFKECKRKFLYKYGESLVSNFEKEEVRQLKKLKSLSNWLGENIHKFIDIYINNESLEEVLSKFSNAFSVTFRNPEDKIFEFYYGIPVSKSQVNELRHTSVLAIKNFVYYYNLNLRQVKNNIIFRDSQSVQSFIFEGITILYRPDLVIKNGQIITIFDWKTLHTPTDQNQVDLYMLVFHSMGFENVELKIVNLYPTIKEEIYQFDNQRILKYREFVKNSFEEIKNFWNGLQVFTEQEFDNLFEEIYSNFPMTDDFKLCQKCEFRKLCKRL